jgi:RecB family exonuclease
LLEQARDRAAELAHGLASASEHRPLGERLDALSRLLTTTLGWSATGEAAPLIARLATLRAELPAGLPLSLDELALLLDRALAGLVHEPIGGEGAGVQLLDVTEARARTFEHLFLLGLNRDRFPRVISEDPLLPDEIREALRDVLPELAAKERGYEEERFLFAELVSSSPNVTVSWQIMGDDGKALAPSPLVERLISPRDEVERVPTLLARPGAGAVERTAHEWTLLAGLHGGPAATLLPAALAAARGRPGDGAALSDEAAARTAAVAELDAIRADAWLGPYLGHVGAAREAADLRRGDVWVTTLEKVARCPWQGFLTNLLRLERPPDALEALPEADALLVGSLVHDVLEAVVREHVPEPERVPEAGGRLADARPVAVPWPAPERLEALARHAARELLFRNGIGLPGFASVLVERARPFLEVARAHDWGDGPVPVVGAEVATSLEVATPEGPLRVFFRADRVDRDPEGLRLTDYKTGGSPRDVADDEKRFAELCTGVRQGRLLQAPIYARVSPGARGRYLYLKPEVEHAREFAVSDEPEVVEAFDAAVADVGGALAAGTLPPRLVGADGEEPKACEWCELSIACLRGDSGARRRVAEWAAAPAAGNDPREAALRAIWSMGDAS